jgi:hypothetical protein
MHYPVTQAQYKDSNQVTRNLFPCYDDHIVQHDINGIRVLGRHMCCLYGKGYDAWINDEIVNAWLNIIRHHCNGTEADYAAHAEK